MDEKLRESMASLLDFLQGGMEAGAEFTMEQAPIVLQEFYTLNVVENLYWMGVWVLIWGSVFLGMRKLALAEWNAEEDAVAARVGYEWSKLILPFLAIVCSLELFFDLAKLIFAPRIYLIEYISRMIKY